MTWRLAKSLEILRAQLDTKYPKRDRTSDGSIGDESHVSRFSDHNAWIKDGKFGVVSALDIDRDIAPGITARLIVDRLLASRDQRIKYVIRDREIISGESGTAPWKPRPYNGANAHKEHAHISAGPSKALYDSATPWAIGGGVALKPVKPIIVAQVKVPRPALSKAVPIKTRRATLQLGSAGDDVGYLQRMLGVDDDNDFGPITLKAVKRFQKIMELAQSGIVDPATWTALEAP